MARIPVYQSQVGVRAGGNSPVRYQTESTDAQIFQQGVGNLTNVAARIQVQKDDSALQDASITAKESTQNIISNIQQLQGKAAVGSSKAALQAFDDQVSQITPPTGRAEDWSRQVRSMRLQLAGMASSHEFQQMEQYRANQVDAIVDLGIKGAGQSYSDPVALRLNNANTIHSIRSYGESQGWSDEQTEARVQDFMQKADIARYSNFATANPEAWLSGDGVQSGDGGGLDLQAIALTESGDSHTNPDGSIKQGPVTYTGERAQGRFQIMPKTGQELAAKRGVKYNPSDPEQHAQLAKDYANELYSKYGSETLAGAAYNWGMGNVDELVGKIGDPRKGEISDQQFIKNLPAETQGWIARYRKNKTGMDPVAMHKIDNIAQSVISEQRALLRSQVDPIVTNTMAQLNNGDVPADIPSKSVIMRAYGNQGQNVIKQMDIAMDNARAFQFIQYMPQSEQQVEMDKLKPQANDPDYANKLEAYGKLTTLVKASNERIQAQRDASKFSDAQTMGISLDPSDKAMQTAANGTQAAQSFQMAEPATHDAIVQQVAQTGIVPARVTSQLTAVSRSTNPEMVRQGAELFNRLYDTRPSSVSEIPKDMQGFYMTIKQLTGAGVPSREAIEQAQNSTFNLSDARKDQINREQSTSDYRKGRDKAASSARNSMSQWFRVDPDTDEQSQSAAKFRDDYQSLYDLNYRVSGGNPDVAQKMTNQQILKSWSISDVNGKASFMKYAPEALYNFGPSGWQAEQWRAEKETLMYGQPLPAKTALGATASRAQIPASPASLIGGELEITPDVQTPTSQDYAIMVRTKDKDGIEGVQPYLDKYGRPMRWRPDLESWAPYQQMLKDRDEQAQNDLTKSQERRAFIDKHRALDEQYKQLHAERLQKVPKYIYGGGEN